MSTQINKSWAERIQPQPMFDVLQRAQIQEQRGEYIARMEIGDTPGFQNLEMHRILKKYAEEPFRYSPSSGESRLKSAVLSTQWPDFLNSNMSVTIAPANYLITAAMASATSPGDIVYLPDPGFPSYLLAANFLGLNVIYYDALENLDLSIRKTMDSTNLVPRIVVINNPSNPLGLAVEGKSLGNLVTFLEGNKVQLVIDETYINLVYEDIDPKIESSSAIRIRSFSKEHCSPGLRIGYAIAPQYQSKVMSDLVSLSISCAPKFIQLAVSDYLVSEKAKSFTQNVRTIMKERFRILEDSIPREHFMVKPNSAFYALIRVNNDAEAFEFLMNRNVSTCPGSKFGQLSSNALRISLAGDAENFLKDLQMLKEALYQYLNI